MARKGQKRGLKRSKAPSHWKIARKEKKWTTNPDSGPHNKEAIPLGFILRDYLGYAHTLKEVKRILNERKVKINGTVRTSAKFPVGILDIVEIPLTQEYYRVLPDRRGRFILHPVTEAERHIRPLKITGKQLVKEGKTQLSFHDGTTLLSREEEKGVTEKKGKRKVRFKPFGTLLYDFESEKILEYIPFAEGNFAMITGGGNVSRSGRITAIKDSMVEIEGEEAFRTLKENVFVLGTKESAISLLGG
jgi:small subunit ribosomal protein S4e